MSYADLNFYQSEYLLGRENVIPFSEFAYWAKQASRQIDLSTFNRLHNAETLEKFKTEAAITTCELAELIFDNDKKGKKTLSSMSIGGYSESYVKDDAEATQKGFSDAITRGLGLSGLLYRGFMEGDA